MLLAFIVISFLKHHHATKRAQLLDEKPEALLEVIQWKDLICFGEGPMPKSSKESGYVQILYGEPIEDFLRIYGTAFQERKESIQFKKRFEGAWAVGFYERAEIGDKHIKNVNGVEFIFEPATASKEPSLVKIDYCDRKFMVSYEY